MFPDCRIMRGGAQEGGHSTPMPPACVTVLDPVSMRERRRSHMIALLLYYVLLTTSVLLLLAKATLCNMKMDDDATERSFKRFACALVLAARMSEIAARRRLSEATAVLAEWALLEIRWVLAGAGVEIFASVSGHVYLVSLSTCFLVFSMRRRQAFALVATKLFVVLLLNAYLLRTILFYHTKSECLGGAVLSMAACVLRVSTYTERVPAWHRIASTNVQ
uniref:Uncharacterized protein n=1 Tax=Antonospora locustae TaxID=278021 RepID=Q95VS4_ANTLO|nr:unknown [Antonospora locustae]|eukprot:jgi/Antlo1/1657/2178